MPAAAQTGGIEELEVEPLRRRDGDPCPQRHARHETRRALRPEKAGPAASSMTGSIAGRLAGFSSSMVYGAAKAARHSSDKVRRDGTPGESNVRVNSISPRAIATGIFGKALGLSVDAAEKTPGGDAQGSTRPRSQSRAPACGRYCACRSVPGQRQILLCQRPRSSSRRRRHRRRNWSQQQQGYVALRKAFDQGAG